MNHLPQPHPRVNSIKDGRTRHEDVRPRACQLFDFFRTNAAFNLENEIQPAVRPHLRGGTQLRCGSRDEGLSAEARLGGENVQKIAPPQDSPNRLERRRGVHRHAGFSSAPADLLEDAASMRRWKFADAATHRLFDMGTMAAALRAGGFADGDFEIMPVSLLFGVRGLIATARNRPA